MTFGLGVRDWGLGISSAMPVTLRCIATGAVLLLVLPSTVLAQPARQTNPTNPTNPPISANPGGGEIPVPPIECWWKTDRSAVRVGEHFTLTLTCAVLDTERVRVVVDESGLAPSALHLVPFEIVHGQRFRDILNAPRRFFQYQYTMRVLGEEFFGKEITLPRLQISYRVQNSLQGGAALSGREAQYSLVPVPIRVLSLVPPGASEIRDTPVDTFGDVERRLFQSNVLLILAGVAFVLAALMAVLVLARAAVKRRASPVVRHRAVSPSTVLRAASRELDTVQTARQREGWNSELAGRAAAAMRLAGAVALMRPVRQAEVDRGVQPGEGQVPTAPGLRTLRGKKLLLSAAVTTASENGNAASESPVWDSLRQPLGVFTHARYSRESSGSPISGSGRPESANGHDGIDATALDSALADGQDAIRRLRVSLWRRFPRARRHPETEMARPTWVR
jgi:hypothetical protein